MANAKDRKPGAGLFRSVIIIVLAAAATFVGLALLQNINERQAEGQQYYLELAKLDETTVDPEIWGRIFPRQYDSYQRTVDTQRTTHGGSEAFQKLDDDPLWRKIFAGYGFSIDYREERGHAYMLSDQRETERVTTLNQPGACLHCHAANIPAYRQAGIEHGAAGSLTDAFNSVTARAQLQKGFEVVCAMDYNEATTLVAHPVSCMDCHDPGTMALRVTRPGFLNGVAALAKSDYPMPHLPSIERWREGDRTTPYDPNVMASRQEMRSMACGQCHVEYYFSKPGNLLTYPWSNGLLVEQVEAYYDDLEFKDWIHAEAGSPMLKAQHPEFEMWSQGIHARAGVSCADCHMPYQREGSVKVSDHHIKSPLLNVARACQTCHRVDEAELVARAEKIQERTKSLMMSAEHAVVDLIDAIHQRRESGWSDERLAGAQSLHRKAQWRLDYVAAENSMGFHADQEAARILGESMNFARQGEIALLKQVEATQSNSPSTP